MVKYTQGVPRPRVHLGTPAMLMVTPTVIANLGRALTVTVTLTLILTLTLTLPDPILYAYLYP